MMRDISLHIMDIIQNSISAGAKNVKVSLCTESQRKILKVSIDDDGDGMSEEFLEIAANPFATTRTTRKIGLGIPLFKLSGEIAGGDFSLNSKKGYGTSISVSYKIHNINRIPLGDIGETITTSLMSDTDKGTDFELYLDNEQEKCIISTKEIAAHLDGVPLTDSNVLGWLKEYINSNVYNIFHGILEEIQ